MSGRPCDLDELEKLAKVATCGPWKAEEGTSHYWRLLYHGPTRYGKHWEGDDDWALLGQYDRANGVEQYAERDAAFIAAARNALPELIARLRAAERCAALLLTKGIITAEVDEALAAWRAAKATP